MLKIEFSTDNAAFGDGDGPYECKRILEDIAEKIAEHGRRDGGILDINGNRIGRWSVTFAADSE